MNNECLKNMTYFNVIEGNQRHRQYKITVLPKTDNYTFVPSMYTLIFGSLQTLEQMIVSLP